jgi:serine/threonine protein kinase
MSTADDDDEKTLSGPPTPASRRARVRDDAETGLQAERRRGRAAEPQPGHTLPLGTRLRDYEITGLIGEGGFGIVYLAWDHSLQRKIAIKEYMPASMAARVNGSSAIVVKSERHLDTFRAGLKSFVNEGRLLARFDHPSLVKVYRFWEENGTAYMVMPYYEGPTLKAALAELGRAPTEAELRAWLRPLLDALAVMHAAQCYHRDIAPDNILLTPRGPLLLDFGAARRVIGDMTHAITVVLKPGYAPIEQYGDVATMAQGAWTDLYALACVVYYAIAGKTPTSSVERLMDDRVEPLAVAAAGRYGDAFLRAIDAALAVRPGDRPQTEREFRALLDAGLPAQPADDARDSGIVPYATVPGALAPPLPGEARPPAFEATAAKTALATVPDAPPTPSVEPSTWSEPSSWSESPTSIELPTASQLPGSSEPPASMELPSPATVGASRNPAATLLIGVAVIAVIATVVLFAWLQQRGPAPVDASAAATASATPAAASIAAPSLPNPAASAPTLAPPPTNAGPVLVEQTPVEAPAAVEAKIDRPPDAAPVPPTAIPVERATVDGEAASGVATPSPPRPARPRRESPAPARTDNAAVPPPTAPRAPTVSARCSDILQKASLEPLTATEAAYLKRECR